MRLSCECNCKSSTKVCQPYAAQSQAYLYCVWCVGFIIVSNILDEGKLSHKCSSKNFWYMCGDYDNIGFRSCLLLSACHHYIY